MKPRKIALTGILMSIVFQSIATGPDSLTTGMTDTVQPLQISFITPLGTNGTMSTRTVNNLSLNIIAGYHSGLEGIEVGGLANILHHDMNGIQVAGFTNLVGGNVGGIQVAGFANLIGGRTDGIMLSGFTNHSSKGGQAIQIAGFSNQSMGQFTGAQVAGFGNVVLDSAEGVQIAGFGNYAGNRSHVTQIAGFLNTTQGEIDGVQAAGFLNHAKKVEGVQVSGFLNLADTVSGLQIGMLNHADTFTKGVPIGLVSFVDNGYKSFNLQINDLQWVEGQFQTGVDAFYNIFPVALKPFGPRPGWAFGYGVGTTPWNAEQHKMRVEAIAYHINENEMWTSALNNLIRLNTRYEFHPTRSTFSITAGPSLNLLVSSLRDVYGEDFQSKSAPYSILSSEGEYVRTQLWVGGQVGVTF